MEHFISSVMYEPMQLEEQMPLSRTLTYFNVSATDDIQDLFDTISYKKGASIIHMFMHAFSESSFKKGNYYYLTKK